MIFSTNTKGEKASSLAAFWVVAAVAACVTLPWLPDSAFWSRGEPREAIVMQSVYNGNFILPRGYGDVVASKPPLLHWTGAALSSFWGKVTEASARLPSAIASFAFVVCFFLFLKTRMPTDAATLIPLVLLMSPEWLRTSVMSRVDMLHSGALAGALLLWFRATESRSRLAYLGSAVLFIASFLAKGPVAVVLGALTIGLYLLVKRAPLKSIAFHLLKIFVPVCLVSLLWYGAAAYVGEEEFLDKVYFENIHRFSGGSDDTPHSHSVFYLLGAVFLGAFPWTLFAAIACSSMREDLRGRLRNSGEFEKFCFIAFASIFLFYAIPSGKRGVYLLAAYPFLSVLLVRMILFGSAVAEKRIAATVKILAGGVLLIAVVLPVGVILKFGGDGVDLIWGHASLSRVVFYALAVVVATRLSVDRRKDNIKVSVWQGILLIFAVSLALQKTLAPVVALDLSRREFVDSLISNVPPDEKLYSFEYSFYDISFYLERTMFDLPQHVEEKSYILVRTKSLSKLTLFLGPKGLTVREVVRSERPVLSPDEQVVLVQVVPQNAVTLG